MGFASGCIGCGLLKCLFPFLVGGQGLHIALGSRLSCCFVVKDFHSFAQGGSVVHQLCLIKKIVAHSCFPSLATAVCSHSGWPDISRARLLYRQHSATDG